MTGNELLEGQRELFMVLCSSLSVRMPKEILEQLFDSPVKARLLKFFLRNQGQYFELSEIVRRVKASTLSCQQQVRRLGSIKFIKARVKNGRKSYTVNPNFDFYNELKTLILKSSPASKQKMLGRIKGLGRINLAILSGIFVNSDNARADLLLVGDGIKKKSLSGFLRDLEAEAGKEIDYVVLSTKDFKYRYDMFDRFIRDILEKPHDKLINKLRI